MEDYCTQISDGTSKGSAFLGVFRGKLSEGINFADHQGRAVVITGIPYPPARDARILLQKQYLDELYTSTPAASRSQVTSSLEISCSLNKQALTGSEWYSQEAFRAVNQAAGRVIRHRDDYGAILLCDERFATSKAQSYLPVWLRPYVTVHRNFDGAQRSLGDFFQNMTGERVCVYIE